MYYLWKRMITVTPSKKWKTILIITGSYTKTAIYSVTVMPENQLLIKTHNTNQWNKESSSILMNEWNNMRDFFKKFIGDSTRGKPCKHCGHNEISHHLKIIEPEQNQKNKNKIIRSNCKECNCTQFR